MKYQGAIITVTNSIHSTSMEFNEFFLYRIKHYPDELHFLISYMPIKEGILSHCDPDISKNIRLVDCQGNPWTMRKRLKDVIQEVKQNKIPGLFHFGHTRPALLTHLLCPISLRRIPSLFTVHSSYKYYPFPSKILSLANFLLTDQVNYVGRASSDAYPRWLRKLKGKSVHTITNGVDLDRVDAFLKQQNYVSHLKPVPENTATKKFRLINIGRLVGAKNQKWLIELMTDLPKEISLTICGSGALENELKNLARRLKVEHRIKFTGLLEREDVYQEILASDLFVSSSTREGLPIAVLEAMALYCPTILSDIPPHQDIGQYGESACLIGLDKTLWRQRIESFRKNHQHLNKAARQNRKIVESHFSLASMHENYTKLYRTMWSNQSRAV